jgi:hypothetical protein
MGKLEEVPFEWTPPPNGNQCGDGSLILIFLGGLKMPWFWVLGKEYCNQRTASSMNIKEPPPSYMIELVGVFFFERLFDLFQKIENPRLCINTRHLII